MTLRPAFDLLPTYAESCRCYERTHGAGGCTKPAAGLLRHFGASVTGPCAASSGPSWVCSPESSPLGFVHLELGHNSEAVGMMLQTAWLLSFETFTRQRCGLSFRQVCVRLDQPLMWFGGGSLVSPELPPLLLPAPLSSTILPQLCPLPTPVIQGRLLHK